MTTRLLELCGYAEVSFDSAERREEILRCGVSNHDLTLLTHKTVSRRSQMCEKLGWSHTAVSIKPHEPAEQPLRWDRGTPVDGFFNPVKGEMNDYF